MLDTFGNTALFEAVRRTIRRSCFAVCACSDKESEAAPLLFDGAGCRSLGRTQVRNGHRSVAIMIRHNGGDLGVVPSGVPAEEAGNQRDAGTLACQARGPPAAQPAAKVAGTTTAPGSPRACTAHSSDMRAPRPCSLNQVCSDGDYEYLDLLLKTGLDPDSHDCA